MDMKSEIHVDGACRKLSRLGQARDIRGVVTKIFDHSRSKMYLSRLLRETS